MAAWENDPIEGKAAPWESDPIEGKMPPAHDPKKWAEAEVAKERAAGFKPSISFAAKGVPFIGPFLDEAAAGIQSLPHYATGGAVGRDYTDNLELIRAREKAVRDQSPVGSFAEELAGGIVTPMPFLKAGDGLAKTTGKLTAIGAPAGYAAGFGNSEGDLEQRHESGKTGAVAGAALGLLLPAAGAATGKAISTVADAVSPTLARWKADLGALAREHGIVASADGGIPSNVGANAAADQIIANQLHRAGRSVDDLRATLGEAAESARFHSSGRAQDALAPVDLDPSLQRLAGSVARASPEAGNAAQAFVSGRQTGITPAGGLLPETAGIPTRPMLARPQADDPPMGQGDRLRDAFKRALLIRDEDFHGHAANALRTDKAILEAARGEAKALYGDAYAAGQNINIAPALEPVLQKWQARLVDEPKPVGAVIQRVMGLFTTKNGVVSNLERFDKSKQFADGVIEKFFESPIGRNRYVGGILNEFKNDMLKAVDAVNVGGLGQKYAAARAAFGSRMEAREALQAGRDVFKADADAGVDAFRAMTTPGQQKLFRLGMLSGYEKAAAAMKRGADKTQIFDNPRIQELLSEVIPRTETATGKAKAGAVFADRPERFGRYIGNEKRMIETRDQVLGNSKTAQRLKDDEAFNDMNALNSAIDKFKQSGSVLNVAVKAIESLLNKLFGMRADTAASLSRKLFTASPLEREQLLAAVAQRMGPDRFSQFSKLMQQYQAALAPAGVSAGTSVSGQ